MSRAGRDGRGRGTASGRQWLAAGLAALVTFVFVGAALGAFGRAGPAGGDEPAGTPTAAAIAAAPSAEPAYPSPTAEPCALVLELRSMAEAVGPDVVGECLEHERFDPATGDRLQRTRGGLLVWRDQTRTAAFTDGHRTWVRGPYGLQERLRRQRFDWELTTNELGAPVLSSSERQPARVVGALDSETLALQVGDRAEEVSLVGIDAPQPRPAGASACLGEVATAQLGALAPFGATVRLEADPGLDARDEEGRRQLYAWLADGRLLNRELVRLGLAVVADDGGRSRMGLLLRAAERQARGAEKGLWSPIACGSTADPAA